LKEAEKIIPSDFKAVILTGEYTPFNLMTDRRTDHALTGMIDFGDTMIGYHEYDLLGPSVFLCEGNPVLVQSLLHGYGYLKNDINPSLRRRLMTLQILHRYSNFNSQLRIPDWQHKVHSILQLEQLIWPI
jgi:hygromycin-B 7''-O-kinase